MSFTNTFTSGTTAVASEVNQNFSETKWQEAFNSFETFTLSATSDTLAHSATTWTRLNGTSTKRTTDTGATWNNVTADVAECVFGVVCAADKTLAICFGSGDNVALTTDSGDNWTSASADPGQTPMSADFPTATSAVIGTDNATNSIYISSDGGDNWAAASVDPGAGVYAISMFSGTTGFAIADGGGIWKTTDSGDNWTDTTHTTQDPLDASSRVRLDILAISTTEFVGVALSDEPKIIYYDGSGSPTVQISLGTSGTINISLPFRPLKLTNGSFIYGLSYKDTAGTSDKLTLYKAAAKDSVSVQSMPIEFDAMFDSLSKTNSNRYVSILQEYDTDKIMLGGNRGYILIDESLA